MQQRITEQYLQHKEQLTHVNLPWLTELREEALTYFIDQGLPTPRQENYKYTNLERIGKTPFVLSPLSYKLNAELVDKICIDKNSTKLVFVNGYFTAVFSKLENSQGNYFSNFTSGLKENPDFLRTHLQKDLKLDNGITALNTSLYHDGAILHIKSEEPCPLIELIFLHDAEENTMQHLSNLIILDEKVRATIIEHHFSAMDKIYLKTSSTFIHCAANSELNYFKIQNESSQGYHLSQTQAYQDTASTFNYMNIDLGGKLVRNDLTVSLAEPEATCQLNGLYLATGKQHIDNHTFIKHQSPSCTSKENYKGIIKDKARAVFNGRVLVQAHAQKTNAAQNNANLLLSDDAEIDTKPQLEIFADDVKCAHGASIGQLDEEAIFYLQSRGIDLEQAKSILTFGFAYTLINDIADLEIKKRFLQLAIEKLGQENTLHQTMGYEA